MLVEKDRFLNLSTKALKNMYDTIQSTSTIKISNFNNESTVLIIVDIINGFVKRGNLKSSRIFSINDRISEFSALCEELKIKKVVFADSHPKESPEFLSYPIHCLEGSEESEVTDELKNSGEYTLIKKNSTNGFLEPEFQKWLKQNNNINNFIIVGCCTDICIQQIALTIKSDFNRRNLDSRVVVPSNLVETYDSETHSADLLNVIMLYNMLINGVEVVPEIEY